jgi:hypothetical protein
MQVGGMVRDNVHNRPDTCGMQGRGHRVEILQAPDPGIDIAVVI